MAAVFMVIGFMAGVSAAAAVPRDGVPVAQAENRGSQVEPLVAAPGPGAGDSADPGLMGFFFIGLVINLAVMGGFAWWFVGEWKRTRSGPGGRP
ncbi:MAG: hypothetical protein U5S82_05020 [Gammaproteobacteria bacterium]|nr:hypothetical protein [Gammaproteobacteria bacterium]